MTEEERQTILGQLRKMNITELVVLAGLILANIWHCW